MKTKFLFSIAGLVMAFSLISFVSVQNTYAQSGDPVTGSGEEQEPVTGSGEKTYDGGIENPIGLDTIQDLLAAILSAIVQIAIPFLVLAVMWVGFLFVAARGNPNKLADARQALFYTLIGALIILGAQTLSVILSGTISQLTEGVGN